MKDIVIQYSNMTAITLLGIFCFFSIYLLYKKEIILKVEFLTLSAVVLFSWIIQMMIIGSMVMTEDLMGKLSTYTVAALFCFIVVVIMAREERISGRLTAFIILVGLGAFPALLLLFN